MLKVAMNNVAGANTIFPNDRFIQELLVLAKYEDPEQSGCTWGAQSRRRSRDTTGPHSKFPNSVVVSLGEHNAQGQIKNSYRADNADAREFLRDQLMQYISGDVGQAEVPAAVAVSE